MTSMTPDSPGCGRADELLPCPFCGGEAMIGETLDNAWYAMCRQDPCVEFSRHWSSKDQAIAAWNTRAEPAERKDEGRVAELEAALRPFADALDADPDADASARDTDELWDRFISMAITFGHLRAARATLNKDAQL